MQNIFLTFEPVILLYLYTRNPFDALHNERADFQYFINLQTIFRAKRGAKIQKVIHNNK